MDNDEKIVVDEAQDAAEGQQEQKEAIPDELAGLSEDTAREIMQQAEQDEGTEEGEDQGEASDESHAEQDSDNKPVETTPLPNTKIPYARFKQEVDKRKQLEERLAALEAQQKQAQPPAGNTKPVQPQPPAPQVQQPPAPQLRFTPDVQKAMSAYVDQQAMAMTGMSKDDIDAMEYMDDTDPRKLQYQTARKYAETSIMNQIYAAQQEQQRRNKAFLENHRKNIDSYNAFAVKEMQEPDFEQVKNFAINEFYEKLPEHQQPTIAAAYSRIGRNTANDADIILIEDYFNRAKAAYRQNNPLSAPTTHKNTKQKMKQAVNMPRAGQVDGTSGYSGAVTGETLAEMMRTTPWGEIPEQYRNMILSAKTK